MRWTIQRQFLLPVVGVATLCFVAMSVLAVYVTTGWAQQREREQLDQVVKALTEAGFPLSSTVLSRMSQLSGAELAVVDAQGRPVVGPDWLDDTAPQTLNAIPIASPADLSSQRRVELSGETYFAARVPLVSQSSPGRELSMIVLYPEYRWMAVRRQLGVAPLAIGLVGIAVLSLAITVVATHVVAPLERLRCSAQRIAEGDFSSIPLPKRNDEVQDLTRAINAMAERLSRYEVTVRQNERLRTLGQLSGGLAHQFRNAATGARMALDFHARSCTVDESDGSLAVAIRQLALMESYIQRFLTLGQPHLHTFQRIALEPLVREAVELADPSCKHAKIELDFLPTPGEMFVAGDCKALEQVVSNLLSNAIEAVQQNVGAGRRVTVELRPSERRTAMLVVEDTGPGPGPAMQDQLFEPFATDKPSGTGLGLAVVKTIVDEHQGTIEWQRVEGRTRFTVEFPLSEIESEHGTPVHCG
jgi:signal transduction histidine kinase